MDKKDARVRPLVTVEIDRSQRPGAGDTQRS